MTEERCEPPAGLPPAHLPTAATTLPRELTVTIVTRAVALCLGLTALVFLMQLVRALDRLPPHLAVAPSLLAELALYTTPALLTLTLPMALLVAAGLTLGERVANGELDGWAALGRPRTRLVRGVVASALALSIGIGALAGWIAPLALDRAATTLGDTTRNALTASLDGDRAVLLDGGLWIAAERAHDAPLAVVDLVATDPTGRRTVRADRATLLETRHTATLRFDALEVVSRDAASPCVAVSAQVLEVPIATIDALAVTDAVVPALERRTAHALWSAASTGDARSGGQLVKRLVLVALPPMLVLLLLAGCSRLRALGRPEIGMLAALGLATALHAVARGCELVARVELGAGVALAVATCVGVGSVGALGLRRT